LGTVGQIAEAIAGQSEPVDAEAKDLATKKLARIDGARQAEAGPPRSQRKLRDQVRAGLLRRRA
jgi:hypothetical protein